MKISLDRLAKLLLLSIGGAIVLSSCQTTKIDPAAVPSASPTSVGSDTQPVKTAERVVALTSLSADIIHRLQPNKLVGVTGSKLLESHPVLSKTVRVGEGRTPPNLEKIVALKPDLVIGAAGMHDGVLGQLQQSGIQTIATKVDRWESLAELTKQLATAVGADPQPLLASYQGYFDSKPTKTSPTLILAGDKPLLAPNGQSWAGDLLTQFDVKNVVKDLQGKSEFSGYLTLSPENLIAIDPEVLILIQAPGTDIDRVKSNPLFKNLKASKNNRIHVFDYYGLVNPGSVEAIADTAKKLRQIYQ
jgi:iron complex transport system substrate-binding protein